MFSFFQKSNNFKKSILGIFVILTFVISFDVVGAALGDSAGNEERINTLTTQGSSDSDFKCPWLALDCYVAEFSYNLIFKPVSGFVSFGGKLFNGVLETTIFNMKATIYGSADAGSSFVEDIWGIFRDIANIVIIFVLVYTAIQIIIHGSTSFGKAVPIIIIVAIFINFSLYFTKIIIDVSNVLAKNIYESAISVNNSENAGIITVFINTMRLETALKEGEKNLSETVKKDYGSYTNAAAVFLLNSIMLLIVVIVLFIGSLMLITRLIFIIIILFTSSLAVGSYVSPALKKQIWDKWWNALVGQASMAPIFILMLLISAKTLEALEGNTIKNDTRGEFGWKNLVSGDHGAAALTAIFNLLFPYLISVGLLIAALKISKSLSAMAGSRAGKMTSFIGSAALNTTAFAGRQIGGRALGGALSSGGVKDLANSNNAAARMIGGTLLAGGARLKKATFDTRNAPGVSRLVGQTGIDIGKASNKTADSVNKEAKKKAEERFNARIERRTYTSDESEKREEKIKEKENAKKVASTNTEINSKTVAEVRAIEKIKEEELKVLKEREEQENKILEQEKKILTEKTERIKQIESIKSTGVNLSQAQTQELNKLKSDVLNGRELKNAQNKLTQTRSEVMVNETEKTEITKALTEATKDFSKERQALKKETIKKQYLSNRTADKQDGFGEDVKRGPISILRGNNPLSYRSNRAARDMLRAARKGQSDQEKMLEQLAKQMKEKQDKENKSAPENK
jgi:hypothetical protein